MPSTCPNWFITVLSFSVLSLGLVVAPAQTAFLDFNTTGQYGSSFNPWNDNGGVNGGNYSFQQVLIGGAGGGGCVNVFANLDTTAVYKNASWDFSTNGATIFLSTLIKANGQTSGNKVQLGILNLSNNGLNNNAGVAFESFRFIPSATTWSLREQYRTANALTENILGDVSYTAGRWYKFVVALTNTSGASGNYGAACSIYDYGTDGLTPGQNMVTFSTVRSNTGQEIATNAAVWPALRGFQNGGFDAWDNFLVYTPRSKPVITLPLTNTSAIAGQPANFIALADGPGAISYSWYTNGLLVAGASASSYTTPPVSATLTNVSVVANNSNGAVTNFATVTVVVASLAVVSNLPATNIQTTSADVSGRVVSTGGDAPTLTLYYGQTDGGTNAANWSNSVGLGVQTGTFTQTVGGLQPNTSYFFTVKAVNAAGTAWALPSGNFTTLAITLPSVTNLPASGIQNSSATINGQVLSSGGETPTVTFFYGPNDGGQNPGAWSNSVSKGPQTALFSHTLTGLSSNTTYFFTAQAINSAGTAWASPAKSFVTLASNPPPSVSVALLTYHNDIARTGVNTNETVLTVANVNTNTFGLVFSHAVDDWIYAAPLVMTNVLVPGLGTHNLVLVATVNDTVYAFDADDPSVTTPYWQKSFLGPNVVAPKNTDMTGACGGNYQDFHGNMGIVGTPVIDPSTSTYYVVAKTKENGSTFVQRLHALDIATGAERPDRA